MTDIEIVRTLAEFEGIWPEDAASEPFERGDSWCVAVPFSKGTVCQYLRKYTTSYDAVAPVYMKFIDKHGTNQDDIPWRDNWFETTPRQHAEALALEIIASKENRNG